MGAFAGATSVVSWSCRSRTIIIGVIATTMVEIALVVLAIVVVIVVVVVVVMIIIIIVVIIVINVIIVLVMSPIQRGIGTSDVRPWPALIPQG